MNLTGTPGKPMNLPEQKKACLLKKENIFIFFSGTLFLFLTRWDILTNPPYWDAMVGPFVEAVWLKNNHFDFWKLITEQPGYCEGGAAVYLWSIVPTFYAGLYNLLDTPTAVFVSLHSLYFVLAGLMAAVTYDIARRSFRFPAHIALLAVANILSYPIYSGQIDSIGADLLVSFACLLVAREFLLCHYWRASILSVAALLIKESAILICFMNFSWGLVFGVIHRHNTKKCMALVFSSLLPVVFRYGVVALLSFLREKPWSSVGSMGIDAAFRHQLHSVGLSCPEIYCFYLICMVLSAGLIIKSLARQKNLRSLGEWINDPLSLKGCFPQFYAGSIATIFFVFQWMNPNCLPRYITWYLAFFFLFFIATALKVRLPIRYVTLIFSIVLFVSLVNQNGELRPELPLKLGRNGYWLERSREYRHELQSNQRIARFLEKYAQNNYILCHGPMDIALAVPEMGYVSQPLNVFSATQKAAHFKNIRHITDLKASDLGRIWVLYQPNSFDFLSEYPLAPQENRDFSHTVVYEDSANGSSAIVYTSQLHDELKTDPSP